MRSALRWYFWGLVAELAARGWIPSRVSTEEAEETRRILLDAVSRRQKTEAEHGKPSAES